MEYIFLLIPIAIFVLAYLFRGTGKPEFKTPEVSEISNQALAAFERAPSLWVNPSEITLFRILNQNLPAGFHIHGKVRMEDIIRVRRGVPKEVRWKLRGRVKSRHVDYLITDPEGCPVLAIELDGKAHDYENPSKADQVKTALFETAGLNLKRIRVGDNFHHIAATIASDLKNS